MECYKNVFPLNTNPYNQKIRSKLFRNKNWNVHSVTQTNETKEWSRPK